MGRQDCWVRLAIPLSIRAGVLSVFLNGSAVVAINVLHEGRTVPTCLRSTAPHVFSTVYRRRRRDLAPAARTLQLPQPYPWHAVAPHSMIQSQGGGGS